jgi:EAL domain-containing protein (putative c-di-GMP-specific phosphodiesterase class I)
VTPHQFAEPDLPSQIREILSATGMNPGAVCLEITESIVMADACRSRELLSELKGIGLKLSIDDFGTGYSSLSRLRGFPVDSLKIDRAFIANMCTDRESHEIVKLIIMLAHAIKLEVVAEGIETEQQATLISALGCELGQGFFFSRPIDPERMTRFLKLPFSLHNCGTQNQVLHHDNRSSPVR